MRCKINWLRFNHQEHLVTKTVASGVAQNGIMSRKGGGGNFAARGGELVHLVRLVHLVSLVCLVGLRYEIHKINQTNKINCPGSSSVRRRSSGQFNIHYSTLSIPPTPPHLTHKAPTIRRVDLG